MLTIGEKLLHLCFVVVPVHKGPVDVESCQLHLIETSNILCDVLLTGLVNHIARSADGNKMVPAPVSTA